MEAPVPRLRRVELRIDGMRTVHCVRAVFQGLAGVPGVRHADVAMGQALLDIEGDLDTDAAQAILEPLGYTIGRVTAVRSLPTLPPDDTTGHR